MSVQARFRISNNCDRSEQLLVGKNAIQPQLDTLPSTLDDLDELGEIMTEMLYRQETVEVSVTSVLS
jgi:hypothetical protein